MADPAEVKTTMAKLPRGEWALELEDDTEVELSVAEVDVDEDEGFRAEGRNEDQGYAYRLEEEHDGTVRLDRRSLEGGDWSAVGTVAWAEEA